MCPIRKRADQTKREAKRGRLWFAMSLLLALSAVVVAIYFSGQSGEESHALSRGIVAEILNLLGIEADDLLIGRINYFLRRGAHLTLYFCMGLGLTGVFCRQKRLPAWVPAMMLGVAFAATDEFHQLFSGGRSGRIQDVFLDACGLAVGSLVAWLLRKHWIG